MLNRLLFKWSPSCSIIRSNALQMPVQMFIICSELRIPVKMGHLSGQSGPPVKRAGGVARG